MRFCPTCRYYLYLEAADEKPNPEPPKLNPDGTVSMPPPLAPTLTRVCRTCNYREVDTQGGLVLEMDLQEKTSEGYKVLMNEFTTQDPTLPHIKTVKCPNDECASNKGGKERDVIYLKYDSEHMKYLYICNVCDTQWRTKS
jgi:DNA-directed RNA polymerase subunit M/transcription elongation factor TFIIS